MASWDYRVVRAGNALAIRPVYYSDDTKQHAAFAGVFTGLPVEGRLDALRDRVGMLHEALDKPILDAETLTPINADAPMHTHNVTANTSAVSLGGAHPLWRPRC